MDSVNRGGEKKEEERLETGEGGGEIRNDTSWIMVVVAVFLSRPMLRKSFTDSSSLGAMAPEIDQKEENQKKEERKAKFQHL